MLKRLSEIIFGSLADRLSAEFKVEREVIESRFASEIAELRQSVAEMERRLKSETESRIAYGEEAIIQTIYDAAKRTTAESKPNSNPMSEVLRDVAALRWNVKWLGAEIARKLYDQGLAGADAALPRETRPFGLKGQLCRQEDIESEWMRYWCGQLKLTPVYSRKVWEYGYILQVLWEAGVLQPGRRGLGFAVGAEPTPAFLASLGIEILATDIAAEDDRSIGWRDTAQHAANLNSLFRHEYLDRASFDRLCGFRPVDMNEIPADLSAQFDFCWSMCSFEHVGSTELGLRFVENSIKCLKPGGVAVHTTEFSFEPSDETIDNWPTVLFQERHIAVLGERLAAAGHRLLDVDYNPGDKVLDGFIDSPPYEAHRAPKLPFPNTPHLRLNVDGFACTSIGLIVQAGG